MNATITHQDYGIYTEEDHATWALLSQKQSKLHNGRLSKEYLSGLTLLQLDGNRIISIEEVSRRLESISGWTLLPVTGLIPTKDFFYMLINKKYPININMRKPVEIEFSEQPDIFHDVCGHLPLLTNEKFTRFLTAFSIIALKYVNNERAIEFLGRLYWYTYEMGLIIEGEEYKPYGGAIITSAGELANVANAAIAKHPFSISQIFNTPYNPHDLQQQYFCIRSFDELFESLTDLEDRLIENLLLPVPDLTIRNYSLNARIGKGFNNVIGFLNDIQYRFPKAISFVAGQPDENYFEINDHLATFDVFVDHVAQQTGVSRKQAVNKIGQYSKTKGIVNELVAEYLQKDENIKISSEHILMTVGAQEAFSIIVGTVCDRNKDVVLVENPSYIGLSTFAKIFDYNIEGVDIDEDGIILSQLKNKIIEVNRSGKRVKLLYLIPDYQNPSGACMPIGNRLKLLEFARQYNFLIIEDGVYNSFTYAQKRNPTLKSLDRDNRVIYVGSFSKSLFPGLRVGLIVADQYIENEDGESSLLINEMVKVKAHITNNTSTISQAILGGVLLKLGCSLSEWSRDKYRSYKIKRDLIVDCLNNNIEKYQGSWAAGISWNEPDGGFFIKMRLPVSISDADVFECAKTYGIIFCPMRYFYLGQGGENEIRLTFSNLSLEEIAAGIKQLSLFLRSILVKQQEASKVRAVNV